MKQIKVPLTPREWAEKRFQAWNATPTSTASEIDSFIENCGFVLKEEEKPQMEAPPIKENTDVDDKDVVNIPTDKVEAVKYFLNQLPEGYKQRALAQVDEKRVNNYVLATSLEYALSLFCIWINTKEGVNFWMDVHNHYFNQNQYPTLPPLPEEKLDEPSTKEWTGYFTESGERVYVNGEYVFDDVKMRIEKKASQYVCVREDGFIQPLYHVFIYHKP